MTALSRSLVRSLSRSLCRSLGGAAAGALALAGAALVGAAPAAAQPDTVLQPGYGGGDVVIIDRRPVPRGQRIYRHRRVYRPAPVYRPVPVYRPGYRVYRPGYRYYRPYPRYGPRYGSGVYFGYGGGAAAAGVIGLATGIIASQALNPPYVADRRVYRARRGAHAPWTPEWYAYCSRKYRSFNPRTGHYLAYSGRYRFCR